MSANPSPQPNVLCVRSGGRRPCRPGKSGCCLDSGAAGFAVFDANCRLAGRRCRAGRADPGQHRFAVDQCGSGELHLPEQPAQRLGLRHSTTSFPVVAQQQASNGLIQVAGGAFTPVSGDANLTTVRFRVTGAGAAQVCPAGQSLIVSSSTHEAIPSTMSGATFVAGQRARDGDHRAQEDQPLRPILSERRLLRPGVLRDLPIGELTWLILDGNVMDADRCRQNDQPLGRDVLSWRLGLCAHTWSVPVPVKASREGRERLYRLSWPS